MKTLMTRLLPVLLVAAGAVAQSSGDSLAINRKLDTSATIRLVETPLSEAVGELSKQAGLSVHMSPDAMDLMPWGAQTPISAEFDHVPLRQALGDIAAGLLMDMVVVSDGVAYVPLNRLMRLGRRVTPEELQLFGELSVLTPGLNEDHLQTLLERTRFEVDVPEAAIMLAAQIRQVGAGSADEVLESACANLEWSWTVSGTSVVILTPTQLYQQQLKKRITLRMTDRPLMDVLDAIARKTQVSITPDDGVLETLPAHVRDRVSLNANGSSGTEVLQTVTAQTGLNYYVNEKGVVLFSCSRNGKGHRSGTVQSASARSGNDHTGSPAHGDVVDVRGSQPSHASTVRMPAVDIDGGKDAVVGQIVFQLPGGMQFTWFVRESELPAELRDARREQVDRVLQLAVEALIRGEAPDQDP